MSEDYLSNSLLIILISFASAGFGEFISWFLIYRTESYQRLKSTIDKTQKKLDQAKEEPAGPATAKAKDKKVAKLEENLKDHNKTMTSIKTKSTMAIAFTMIGVFSFLNQTFDQIVVAKLPFEPFGFIQGMSHRGLAGSDFTDCSFIFLYVLCSMTIRTNLQKALGFAPPKGAQNPFFPNPDAMKQR